MASALPTLAANDEEIELRYLAKAVTALGMAAVAGAGAWGAMALEPSSLPRIGEKPTEAPAIERAEVRDFANHLSSAFRGAAATVKPSVVPVLSEKQATGFMAQGQSPFDPGPFGDGLLDRFFGGRSAPQRRQAPLEPPVARGVGSGVIVSEDGYILTNNHVTSEADRLWVLIDEQKVEAEVVGVDPATDLAVIKVDRVGLPAARLGRSEDVQVGDWVIAVGNPYELFHTVTAGIVSATSRGTVGLAEYEDFIQTDASINPGNSGGALANLDGEVVGINTAISSPSGGSVGIGFAIPISQARDVMQELIQDGAVSRGYLALVPQDLDPSLAKALELDSAQGALVADVSEDGPADRAGIASGDVIRRFNGTTVEDSRHLRSLVAESDPGSHAVVDLLRGSEQLRLRVELGTRPGSESPRDRAEARSETRRFGLLLENLTSENASRFGVAPNEGAVVVEVEPRGPASRAGMRAGDVIERVGNDSVASAEEAYDLLKKQDGAALVRVRRGANRLFLALETAD